MKNATSFSLIELPKVIWHFLEKERVAYIFFNGVLFSAFFYDLVPPLIVGKIVDFFITYSRGDSLTLFYNYVAFLGISYALVSLIRLRSKYALSKIGVIAKTRARIIGFEKLSDLSLKWHATETTGAKTQRIFTGSAALGNWTSFVNQMLFPIIVSFVGVIAFFLFTNWMFLVVIAGYLGIFLLLQVGFSKKFLYLSDTVNKLNQTASGKYIESSGNMLSIKATGAEKNIQEYIKNSEEASKEAQLARNRLGVYKWYSFQALNGLAIASFFLVAGNQVLVGAMTIGQIVIFYSYFSKLREAANDSMTAMNTFVQIRSDLSQMKPLFFNEDKNSSGNQSFPEDWDSITIQNGSLSYPDGKIALKNFDFTIKKNEWVGIIGSSGSGKSSLVKILLGLYPLNSGSFKIGDVDYQSINHDAVIKNISVVLQETELLNVSLKENITGMRKVNPALLEAAISISELQGIIDTLPDGIDTVVGEKGYALSGGERQRIGIARAICKNAPIFILDEPTSSLDEETEYRILKNFFEHFAKHKTIVCITHRPAILQYMNRILSITNGTLTISL
ncbi:MAG: ABC transporter ATP-binding protein/permease [Candidatus Pacebacteria bacterium]|jgi:ABC-type multidrug transport system fused ATPase/permease subunit|nr:ABC transporter ATP-binding protein/permease [Candidatus Paceibacterota bacterium]